MTEKIVEKHTGKSYCSTKKIATINPNQVNTFHESGCIIHFPKSWVVVKFDETWFFSRLSGQNLKGVDFVAIHPDGRIVLLEIKHYRQTAPAYQEIKHVLIAKMRDSRRIIGVINQYYHRKWYLPLLRLWTFLFKNKADGFPFWTAAAQNIEAPKQCFYIYWLLNLGWEDEQHLQLQQELASHKTLPGIHRCHFGPGHESEVGIVLVTQAVTSSDGLSY